MTMPLKILLLEDVPDDAFLIERILRSSGFSFETRRVDTKDEFIQGLEEFIPQVIISDHALPQFNSLEALKICREKQFHVPFILVTGTVSEEFAVHCLKEGADDYILKDNMTRLPSAITNAIRQHEAEEDRKKAEESLKDQNLKLIKINEELDRFVYSASHDLRAPLKSVLGLIGLAKMDIKSQILKDLESYLDMMEESIFRLDATIREIVNYSRNTRTEIYIEEVDWHSLLDEVLQNLKYMDGNKDVEKTTQIRVDCPLYSDPTRIKIILHNIVSNAIKYRDPRKEKSILEMEVISGKDKAVINVRDNGIGIDGEYIHKIFEMFYRATEKSEGSGLGLYIVKETLEKLRGKINVLSELRKGTTFIIEIPNNQEEN